MHGITTTPKSERVFVEQVFEGGIVKCNADLYRRFSQNTQVFIGSRRREPGYRRFSQNSPRTAKLSIVLRPIDSKSIKPTYIYYNNCKIFVVNCKSFAILFYFF